MNDARRETLHESSLTFSRFSGTARIGRGREQRRYCRGETEPCGKRLPKRAVTIRRRAADRRAAGYLLCGPLQVEHRPDDRVLRLDAHDSLWLRDIFDRYQKALLGTPR